VRKNGFTLIELAISITIMAIAFYLLVTVFTTFAPRTVTVEMINRKTYLAQEKMEEHLAKSFASVASVSATSFTSPSSAYTYQIIVTYVATSDLNTPVAGPTPFKNVKVRVWGGTIDASKSVEVVSVISSYEVK
jgi:prepilin-type N-terminal cleavage/methylation domain-containing protein